MFLDRSSVAAHPLSTFRGPVTLHPPQQMSMKEQYSSVTPKFGRQAEMRHASPQAYHNVVMQPSSWGAHAPLPLTSSYHTPQESGEDSHSPPFSSRAPEDVVLPMENTETLGTLQYLDNSGATNGTTVEPTISATIHKNFFMGEKFYTCYRRNYMACNCSFSLAPYLPGVQLYFTPIGSSTPIQLGGFAMCISAIVSASQHQEVTILQHTPKRDKGPISEPQKHHVGPKTRPNGGSPPHLGGYNDGVQSHSRPISKRQPQTMESAGLDSNATSW
ncbi:hypothetical protein NQ176_g7968 [Zarea fungicola]|uniref:Uncharacterized protein n=1 Tax=Zarea fungicola TaxID=93591 RepID=A0ACC1MV55_9HYPO|nr:hypothetical protein NQ176_g7968 [Lecanicillium fungicola]